VSVTPPPVWARRLLECVLPPAERDFVIGDLEEQFSARLQRVGRARAVAWYWGEVVRSLWPMLTYSDWRGDVMTGMEQDIRGALRVFRRAPGFAAVVVVTVAIGVGGAAAVYSVIRGVVLAPLPFEDSERVVMLWGRTPAYPRAPLTVGDHNELALDVDAFSRVAASWGNTALLLGDGDAEQVSVGWVTPEYFSILGIRPALGRGLERGDDEAIVISHDLWVRRYGSDPGVVGRVVGLDGGSFEIVGVLPADADPNLTTFSARRADHAVWRLQPAVWTQGDDRSVGWLRSTARLRDGVTLAQAQAEVDALFERVNQTVAERDGGTDLRIDLVPVRADMVGEVSRTLWILLGAVLGVLLIAATNVAHLMLGRGELRGGEVAVRAALGGSRVRIVRQMLVESGALALAGGIAGLGVAWWGLHVLLALAPRTLPRVELVRLDGGVLAFALAATALTAMVFGLVPALRASRTDLAGALGERTRSGERSQQRLSRGLVVGQVAVSLALVTGTGLLLRSLAGLERVDLGFDTEGVVTFALQAPDWGSTGDEAAARMSEYIDRMEAVPGVNAVGFTNRVPLAGGLFTGTFRSEEMVAADSEATEASFRYVTSGYLEAMGARLVAGRSFRADDGLDVVLLDQSSAERAWPGQDPIGRRVQTSAIGEETAWAEVVGIVAPMKHAGVALDAAETVFLPMLARADQQNFRYMAVRVTGDPLSYLEPLREAARAVNVNSVVARPRTMSDLFDQDVAPTRFATFLLLVFGGVALLLATVGLHGVMSFSVRRRARELGIRLALGAEHERILRTALGSGAVLIALGIGLGAVLSLGLGRLLQSLLYEVRPSDALTIGTSALVIMAVGLVGAYLPARLVLAVDPARTLREE
jgi:putative ABC transport system permease protein